jgi:hypothetical protein
MVFMADDSWSADGQRCDNRIFDAADLWWGKLINHVLEISIY